MSATPLQASPESTAARCGAIYALGAFGLWGLVPLYWKLLKHVSATEILAHRVVWSAVFFLGLLAASGSLKNLKPIFSSRKYIKGLFISAALIGANWFVYIYAVNSGQLLQASLGYFINPLVNVLLGAMILGERMKPLQWLAFGLATLGVLQLAVGTGAVPHLALFLAVTFGLYGLARKKLSAEPLAASTVESLLLVVPALLYLVLGKQTAVASHSSSTMVLLVLGGVVTGLPLMWFSKAARRLPLSSLGFFQYLSPTISFLLAVFLYGERFTEVHGRSFSLIWTGLAVFALAPKLTRVLAGQRVKQLIRFIH